MTIKPDRGFWWLVLALPLLVPCLHSLPQDRKGRQNPAHSDSAAQRFKVPVDVVVVHAIATDDQGKPILDLTANDFKVYEDGKLRPIHTCALESYKPIQPQDVMTKRPLSAVTEPHEPNFAQPRLFSIVIDDVTASSSDHFSSTLKAVRRFLQQDVGPGDKVAISAGSGRIQYPFTNDKQVLLEEIGSLAGRLSARVISGSSCPTLTQLQARWIAQNAGGTVPLSILRAPDMNAIDSITSRYMELAIRETISCLQLSGPGAEERAESRVRSAASAQYYETQSRISTLLHNLRQHIRSLRHFEARKSVILFSDGFLCQDHVYELQDVVDQALRAGIIVSAVHLGGLDTEFMPASDPSNLPVDLLRTKQSLFSEDLLAYRSPLNQLAHDTGGVFYDNSNDLYAGLQEIANRQAYYYVLTYAAPAMKSDGRYHRIKLEISRPGVQASYRNGYYSPKEELTFERRNKEDILEALQAPGDVNEIPIALSYNYFQMDDSRYEVALVTQVDVRRIAFVEENTRRRNLISLVVMVLDESDRYVDGLVKTVDFNLTPSGYSELISRGFAAEARFQLPVGRYKIKAVVRESTQSRIGSLTKGVEIP